MYPPIRVTRHSEHKPERDFVVDKYECKICGKSFILLAQMIKHLEDEHYERVYPISYIPIGHYISKIIKEDSSAHNKNRS